ncbi:cytochrome P450 [Paraphaeosphaeria sporulosa]|uniref:Cytochrome P450 n=1 Tax=Paraphaeosphaeria sporulosa TaxID=1460663 RepID=A0A177BXG0_9PLEO|nr:cytochrome P450 [Paraphaeosphaeria sporulosa]OAG00005.1 cytochrome P450 [Paraphaeosphaeria sporulosa]
MSTLRALVAGVAVAFLSAALLERWFRAHPEAGTPPVLYPRIPFIGHIIGLLTEGANYYKIASARCKQPIYTLPMLSSQTYVVTSPHLANHIQRASSTLLFEPIILPVTQRMVGFSNATVEAFRDQEAKNAKRPTFLDRLHNATYSLMGPAEIRNQGKVVLEQISQRLNALPDCDRPLFEWCRDLFAQVTIHAFYGPENPFALNPALVKDYWVWERDVIGVMVSPIPQITNRKAYLAREKLAKTMIDYLERKRYTQASAVVQERIRLHIELGVSLEDRGRSEFGMLFGALVNGAITVFWVLNYILSRPDLVKELRAEVEKSAFSVDHSTKTASIVYEALRTDCPLLNSVFRESLRLIAPMTSARFVTEDTIVADTYKLRAQSVVQIAGGVMHEDEEVWGPDAREFNPRRFISTPNGTKTGPGDAGKHSVHSAAFRGFGGGTVFCPGRHFAHIEILSLVAVLLMGWDFKPPQGKDAIDWDPPKDVKRIPIGVMKPLKDVVVAMNRREELRDLTWSLKMT